MINGGLPFAKSRRAALAVSVVGLSLGLAACSGDEDSSTRTTSNSTHVTNPTPDYKGELQFSGSIQGVLRDTATNAPISGAVIDLGFGEATTNARGQFVIRNVPVTDAHQGTAGGLDSGETYKVTIDLSEVNKARKAAGEQYLYPETVYEEWAVKFASFTPEQANEQEGNNLSGGTYHTPITGLVTAVDPQVGKLSTAIQGRVYMAPNQYGQSAFAPAAKASILLVQATDSRNDGAGNSGRVLDTTTADTDGNFRFDKVPANTAVFLRAVSEDGSYIGGGLYHTADDEQTLDLTRIDPAEGWQNGALLLSLAEQQGAALVSVSPENNVDVDPSNYDFNKPFTVEFNFSAPIARNAYADALDASSAAVEGLFRDVVVRYEGAKSSNVPFSLEWANDRKTLVVSLPSLGTSARYRVDISSTRLIDAYGRDALLTGNGANASPTLRFTTRGGIPAEQPEVAVTNRLNVDSHSAVVLNWAPVAGAKSYNIYREEVQVWPNGQSNSHGERLVGTSNSSGWVDTFTGESASYYADAGRPFVERDGIQLVYNYRVAALNSDRLQSEKSLPVQVSDVVPPRLEALPWAADTLSGNQLTIRFNEPVRATDAENIDNYSLSELGDAELVGARYDAGTQAATLQFDRNLAPNLSMALGTLSSVRVGWNGILRTDIAALGDANGALYLPALNINGVGNVALPVNSTDWCAYSDENGNFFSTNSDHYAGSNYEVYAGAPSGEDEVVEVDGRLIVFTGQNGICNSLNVWATDLNIADPTVTWPVQDVSEVGNAWDKAKSAVEAAVLGGINSRVKFRLINQVEAVNQAAHASLQHGGYTFAHLDENPVNGQVSEWTLSEATQNNLAAPLQYFFNAERDGVKQSNSPTAADAAIRPTLANFALRPDQRPQGTTVFRVDAELDWLLDENGGNALLAGDQLVRGAPQVREFVRVSGVRDIAGNAIENGNGNVLVVELEPGRTAHDQPLVPRPAN